MQLNQPAWYCVRTKPKHEHIAAANVRKHCGLEVFHPQLRVERSTRRGLVRVNEPLFPCYIFTRCAIEERLNDIRYASGVGTVVHFGDRIPAVADSVIDGLRACFDAEETRGVDDRLTAGSEVVVVQGPFAGMRASVLRVMPARQRVQVLFEILGRPTTVEVDRNLVALENNSLADMLPWLAVRPDMVEA